MSKRKGILNPLLTSSPLYIESLIKLHENSVVHSDIRKDNLVCSSPLKLFDFDLADEVGKPYLITYNHVGIDECHPDAKASKRRCKSHDQYSLLRIIRTSISDNSTIKQLDYLENKEKELIKVDQYSLRELLDFFNDTD